MCGMAVLEATPNGGYAVLPGSPFVTASVPEPDFLWLFGATVLGLFAWRRRMETSKASRPV
ncbi:MAG: PEP-CTERM sorting domain-containing protein [Rhodanobacteraceae bacterium]|nr:MAG: PEP-CTERM sorting domain-containing protein [Rhodanobacteraceae bacterium]